MIRSLISASIIAALSFPAQANDFFDYVEIASEEDFDIPDFAEIVFREFSMNNLGDVVFTVENFQNGERIIYQSNGDNITLIRSNTNININQNSGVGINDNGVIAFTEFIDNLQALTLIDDGNITQQIQSSTNVKTAADINNANQVALSQSSEIVIADGINTTTILVARTDENGSAVINNVGQAAVPINNNDGGREIDVVDVRDRSLHRIFLGARNTFSDFFTSVGLNDDGAVSYGVNINGVNGEQFEESQIRVTFLDNHPFIIGGGTFTLIERNEEFRRFLGETSINKYNQVLFAANKLNTTGEADGFYLISPSREPHIPVIETGDIINGLTVGTFTIPNADVIKSKSLNNQGQAVFVAQVFDPITAKTTTRLFRANPIEGVTPEKPILPRPGDSEGSIILPIGTQCALIRCFIDPDYAVGYHYTRTTDEAPLFTSVSIPRPLPGGDATFELRFNGEIVELTAGTPVYFTDWFPSGVEEFTIEGISVAEELAPDDPEAFVSGVTFNYGDYEGDFKVSMEPITVFVAEPGDIDQDGDVDRGDILQLLNDRNLPVADSVCGESCDLDQDGIITIADARQLIGLCTRPRCAIE
ncbi:hypothetical protein BIZ37_09350 [Photobacterium sp. BZF1]|uniref:hypothetical protein n=1 Tax=Photobacterium sp. BZF1 TaxID=1904457 RepID=UPI0016538EAF|nr:hypothetical protein [Photobacterium sp. BZF1]MBC7002760.1 hypothetical protein [Photobacterium sp. BZF1]